MSVIVGTTTEGQTASIRFHLDDTTILEEPIGVPNNSIIHLGRLPIVGFFRQTLTAGSHDLDIDIKNDGVAGTSTAYRTVIYLTKVATP